MEKMTIKTQLAMVKDYIEGKEVEMTVADMVAFIDGRIAQLDKKAGTKRAKVEKAEDIALKDAIVEVIGDATMTVKEVREAYDGELTSQKAVAMLKQLVEAGRVAKVVDGKDTKYHAVG